MMRPMPGPPEHRLTAHPHGDDGWCPICHHLTARRPYDPSKRFTDAECAAEFWRAEAETTTAALNHCPECPGCQAIVDEELTWHRFAIYPHGLEVA